MAAVAYILYTDSCSYAHRPFVRAARARVCVSAYTRALAYICTRARVCVCVCVCLCALCCRVVPCGPGLLRPATHSSVVGTQNGPAPRQTVYGGWPPRERSRNARPTIAAAAAVAGRSVGRADCRERAHFRHPWTAARGSLGDSCRRRAVLYRWRRRAPRRPPSAARYFTGACVLYGIRGGDVVGACVSACVLAYVRRAVSVSHSIIIILYNIKYV